MFQYYSIQYSNNVIDACNFDNFISLQVTILGAPFFKMPYVEPYVYMMVNGV